MLLNMLSISITMIISLAVLLTSMIISSRSTSDREKSSPFECGFDPKSSARLPFSLRFFLLAVIFLVFDIEIALLIPVPITINEAMLPEAIFGATLFLLILTAGLIHEWNEGSLSWSP
uniref:NADH dehydrogenase subunit 3 n=1 Tax=Pilargis verrucosa TaxID=1818081 RepID=UPI0030DF01DC